MDDEEGNDETVEDKDINELEVKEDEEKEDTEEDSGVVEDILLSPTVSLRLPHLCAEGLATRIHRVIVRNIIPQLHACLTQKVSL